MASKVVYTFTGLNARYHVKPAKLNSALKCSTRLLSQLNVREMQLELSPRMLIRKTSKGIIHQLRFLQAKIKNNIVGSPFGEDPLEERSLGDVFLSSLERHPNDICLVCSESGRSLTNRDIHNMSKKFGSYLVRNGFVTGDIVCISATNMLEYVVTIVGTLAVGGKICTASPSYTIHELSKQLEETKPKFLICESSTYPVCSKAAKNCDIKEIITFDEQNGVKCLEDLIKCEDGSFFKLHIHEDVKDSVAFILYSSGTTGVPKGTMLTHYNILSNLLQINGKGQIKADRNDTYLGLLPFYHSYGLLVVLLNCVFTSCKAVCYKNFSPTSFLETITKFQVTNLNVVPYLVTFLATHPEVKGYDLSHVKCIVSAAASLNATPPLLKALKDNLPNALLTQGFGMTELSPVAHNCPAQGCSDVNSVGYPIPYTLCKVVDIESGKTLPQGETGELLVKGPQVMKGYLHNQEETSKTINSDGWLHTGDIAYWDHEGKFYVVGRVKELIKYKGLQVSPTELERCLNNHPAVQEAGVAGKADESRGELPVAAITLKSGFEDKITEEDIHKYMEEKLSSHKQLHGGIKFVSIVPRNPTGKISRKEILLLFKD